jgi:hypothetical protein
MRSHSFLWTNTLAELRVFSSILGGFCIFLDICTVHAGPRKHTKNDDLACLPESCALVILELLIRGPQSHIQVIMPAIRRIDIAAYLGCRPFLETDSCQCKQIKSVIQFSPLINLQKWKA